MSNQKEKLWWEEQKNGGWKTLVSPLVQDRKIRAKFNEFIKTFYWKFREKKGISKNAYPEVKFQGFGKFEDKSRAGRCQFNSKYNAVNNRYTVIKLTIFLNQFYLLDQLGMDKLINVYQEGVGWNETPVGFEKLIGTIAHELAHAYQQTVNNFSRGKERSQCESTGDKDANGNLLHPQLAAEHTQLTAEIEQLITGSPEYQNFRSWWKESKPTFENEEGEPESEENDQENNGTGNDNDKKCPECNTPISDNATYCSKCAPEKNKEFKRLSLLLTVYKSPDLTTLEKNYQIVKNSSIYAIKTNQKILDKSYNTTKEHLQAKKYQQSNVPNSNNDFWPKAILIGGGVILIITVISLIFVGLIKSKKKKKITRIKHVNFFLI